MTQMDDLIELHGAQVTRVRETVSDSEDGTYPDAVISEAEATITMWIMPQGRSMGRRPALQRHDMAVGEWLEQDMNGFVTSNCDVLAGDWIDGTPKWDVIMVYEARMFGAVTHKVCQLRRRPD